MIIVDIEVELIPLLRDLTGLPTSTRVPDPRPDAFIQVRRSGGAGTYMAGDRTQILRDEALVDIFVSAPTEDETAFYASEIRGYMLRLTESQPFSAACYNVSEQVAMANSDDTLTGVPVSPRKWLSYAIQTRIETN